MSPLNSHYSDDEAGAAGGENINNPHLNGNKNGDPNIAAELLRAQNGLKELEKERRRSLESSRTETVTMDQVQSIIHQNIAAQTERMTEMFNRVLVDQLSAF